MVIGARNHSAEKQGGIERRRRRRVAYQYVGHAKQPPRYAEDEGLLIPKSLLRRRRKGERGCWDHKRTNLIEE